MSDLKEDLTYRAYAIGWAFVRLLPNGRPTGCSSWCDRPWRKRGKSVRRLEANLARVLGPDATEEQIRAVSKQGMRNYMRYYCDRSGSTWSRERVIETFECENADMLRDLVASGRGIILALPHMGNWDARGRLGRHRRRWLHHRGRAP